MGINYLTEILGIKKFYTTKRISKLDKIEYRDLGFGRFDKVKAFYDLIYRNEIGLERKKEIFESINTWRKKQ